MMKKKAILFIVVALLLCAAGVAVYYGVGSKKSVQTAVPPVQYVSDIISDATAPENVLVRNFNADERSAAVFVLGSGERCGQVAEALAALDVFDNVDGSPNADGLKDFAGETICTLSDYTGMTASSGSVDEAVLREFTVRSVISAMDTLCHVSPYDRSGMGKKPSSKLLVLASPVMTGCGLYDVDSLFSALGCSLPVISPLQMLVDEAVEGVSAGEVLSVGVISSDTPAGIYASLLKKTAARAGIDSVLCTVFKVEEGADPLIPFLDYYSSLGYDRKLSALIVDDPGADLAGARASLSLITSVMNEESMTYGNLVAPGFKLVESGEKVGKAVYSSLRERNVFTHYISQPRRLDYMLLPREGAQDALMLLQYNERYIPQDN